MVSLIIKRILVPFAILAGLWLPSVDSQPNSSNLPQRARRRSPIESEIFLGDWWDYYNRAIRRIEQGDLQGAEADLRDAIQFHPDDNPHARTYGVRFQEYYANLELGMVLFQTGRYAESVTRLQSSLQVAKLDETKFYLHEARRQLALERGDDRAIPQLVLTQPPAGLVTRQNTVTVSGTVSDDLFVDEVYVGDQSILLPKASSRSDFEWEVDLRKELNRIPVVVRDLVGRESSMEVLVTVDQQGPVFNLKKIELASGGDTARVEGEAYDPRQIASITVNGEPAPNDGGVRLPIDLELPVRKETQDIQLAFYDGLGNVTHALLDPRMRVGMGDPIRSRVQVAAIGFDPSWLRAATGGPKIDLMDLTSGQKVYLTEIVVDGFASDQDGIESIELQGDPLDIIPGNHLYFGQLAGPLEKGPNELEIRATDSNRNSATEVLTLNCIPPPSQETEGQLAVSLWPFDVVGSDPTQDEQLSAELRSRFSKAITDDKRFISVDTEELPALFFERELGRSDVIDTRWRSGDQGVIPADLLLDGQLVIREKSLSFFLRVVRVSTGAIEVSLETHGVGKDSSTLHKMAEVIHRKLKLAYPRVEGEIFKVDPQFLTTLAKNSRIQMNAEVLAFHKGEEVILPSGKSVGAEYIPIGRMQVKGIHDEYSIVQPGVDMTDPPRKGDSVITR